MQKRIAAPPVGKKTAGAPPALPLSTVPLSERLEASFTTFLTHMRDMEQGLREYCETGEAIIALIDGMAS